MVGGNSKVVQNVPPFCLADGAPARLCGLNVVGLRRARISRQTRDELKRAFRILVSKLPKQERLAALDELTCPEARQITDFIRHSVRGYCRSEE